MKAYIAASWSAKEIVKTATELLTDLGVTCTNRWQDHKESDSQSEQAFADIDDISRADSLVVLTQWPSTQGGFHWETGYAYARGKRIIVVGKRGTIFHYLPSVVHYSTFDLFIDAVRKGKYGRSKTV